MKSSMQKLVEMAKELGKALTLSKSEIDEIMQKEDLFYSFIRLTPSVPADEDCDHYKTLPIHRMSHINDLLKAGFKLDEIKGYTIWKGV